MEDRQEPSEPQVKGHFDSNERYSRILLKAEEVRRKDNLERAKDFDFFSDPKNIKNARRDMEKYINEWKTFKDKFDHFMNVFSQFTRKYNMNNQLVQKEANDIIKTKRVEYTLNLPRFSLTDEYYERMDVADQAEFSFIHEMRLWAQKYAIFSTVLGINIGSLLFITVFKRHSMFIRLPMCVLSVILTRNVLLHYSLDKIYYPILPVFTRYRTMEKEFGSLMLKSAILNPISEFEDTKIQEFYKSKENLNRDDLTIIEEIDEEIQKEREEVKKQFDIYGELHDNYINDEHFEAGKYSEFLDRYIHWYYEPLLPEYDETKFSIKNFESKFDMRMVWLGVDGNKKKIKGITAEYV